LDFFKDGDLERVFDHLAQQDRLALNAGQRQAIATALTHKVTVLTGGPGTGKTTAVRTIIRLLESRQHSYALAAPTGRAAKRLAEATGRQAKTIHRLLEFKPQQGTLFQRNEENPLEVDMVIIDEASMLDLLLSNHLLKAIHPANHLLLVGDIDQLPSVGAGNVLQDIIQSGAAAVIQLSEIFRQAEGSLIIENAHRINRGQPPRFSKGATDFFLFPAEDAERAADLTVELVQNRIPRRFGFDALDDIQVLSPLHRGAAGVGELNRRLQIALNPAALGTPERRHGSQVFRAGDRVMQIRNNYEKEVFNGDMGRITALDPVDQVLTVGIDDRDVAYEFSELDELVHAYAVSVHKSQGSEYRAVVVPVLTSHYVMLQRNLLYTAVTRAKELVVLVGTRRAIAIAVRNNKIRARHTALDARLRA
jgi:exodeoxyribonuclease V alpha subunit